jgi:hydroxyacylglutathione hydrolase
MRGTMAESARQLFGSLQRLAALPDYLQIWPGHGAGSACGKALGAVPQSTLGYERRTNWALAGAGEEQFVETVLAGQPEPPAYFARMKRINATGVPALLARRRESDATLRSAISRGALVVDVRSPAEFAAGHLPGSLNVPLASSFLAWAGSVVPPDRDVVIVTSAAEDAAGDVAIRELGLIGVDRTRGALALAQLTSAGTTTLATLRTIPASALETVRTTGATVLDVRNRSEWEEGHIPGAQHMPLAELTARLDELRGAGPFAVHCQSGSRSAVAASVLAAADFEVSNVEGGYTAWVRAGNTPVAGA